MNILIIYLIPLTNIVLSIYLIYTIIPFLTQQHNLNVTVKYRKYSAHKQIHIIALCYFIAAVFSIFIGISEILSYEITVLLLEGCGNNEFYKITLVFKELWITCVLLIAIKTTMLFQESHRTKRCNANKFILTL